MCTHVVFSCPWIHACIHVSSGALSDNPITQITPPAPPRVATAWCADPASPGYLPPTVPLRPRAPLQLRALLMGTYFAFDHVVWASHAGLVTDKEFVTRCQKISLYSWMGGSTCTVIDQLAEINRLLRTRPDRMDKETWEQTKVKSGRLWVRGHCKGVVG